MDDDYIENVQRLINFSEQVQKDPLISRQEELKLFSKLKNNPELKDRIAEGNLLAVANYANFYFLKHGLEIDLDAGELIGAGITGLFRAIEKFDTEKGFNFPNYAAWWVRQGMERYILSCE